MNSIMAVRRAVITHLVRQSGGPSPDPRDGLRLAQQCFGLVPRQARVGRFTARICHLSDGSWSLDFNPEARKLELVAAIWHELSELLCVSDDMVGFEDLSPLQYQESAVSSYDTRHRCAVGVERYVRFRLLRFPDVRRAVLDDKIRHILIARASAAAAEPILPAITREPWYDDEYEAGTLPTVV